MAKIALEGMHFYAYHGFYEEEQIIGGEYIVDVFVETNIAQAAATDDLYQTVNYESIFLICQAEMRKPTQLIEAVAQRIYNKLDYLFPTLNGIVVKIKKLAPPLGGRVDCASVEIGSSSGNKGGGSSGNESRGGGNMGGFGGFGDDDFDDMFDDDF